jgi:HD superfamily phosphodiesterase
MRKIIDIYEKYKIMPNLQMHQLRVAAVAKQICESLTREVDKESIIKACLLHDMGNIIKFDLIQTESIFGLSETEIADLKEIKNEFIQKYGDDVDRANLFIAKEIGVSDVVQYLVKNNDFNYLCDISQSGSIEKKIIKYSDLRVGPHGILSYDERMNEAKERYKDYKSKIDQEERKKLVHCGKDIEKEIFSHSNIRPEDVNDESVAATIEELKNFEI